MVSKRAVSPLIATLLLIAVALVIAGILYVWSSNYFAQQTSTLETNTSTQTECAFVGVNIEDRSTESNRVSFNTTSDDLTFKLSNTGTSDLTDDFTITVEDGSSVAVMTYSGDIDKGTFNLVTCTSSDCTLVDGNLETIGSLSSIRVTPTGCPTRYDETSTINNTS